MRGGVWSLGQNQENLSVVSFQSVDCCLVLSRGKLHGVRPVRKLKKNFSFMFPTSSCCPAYDDMIMI